MAEWSLNWVVERTQAFDKMPQPFLGTQSLNGATVSYFLSAVIHLGNAPVVIGLEKYSVAKMRMREETFFGPFRPLGHDDQEKKVSVQTNFVSR